MSNIGMPPQPPTVKMSAMTDRALLEDLGREIRETRGEVGNARADISSISHDFGLLKKRVSLIEELRNEDALRVSKHSGGVRALSASDVGQDLQIASLASKVDTHGKKLDALTESQGKQTEMLLEAAAELKKFVATPAVKMIGAALLGSILSWVASHFGLELPK